MDEKLVINIQSIIELAEGSQTTIAVETVQGAGDCE